MMKRLLKNIMVSALTSPPADFLATKLFGIGIPIFMLHRTYPDNTPNKKQTPAYLRQCLSYLKKNKYHFVSVAEILLAIRNNEPLPKKSIAFTIDDGFVDQASLAAPVFIEFKCPVTIFLITGFLDRELWPWFSKVEYLIKNTTLDRIRFQKNGSEMLYSLASVKERTHTSRELLKYIKRQPWAKLDAILKNLSTTTNVELPDQPPEEYNPMSWDTARDLEAAGVSFGPHTRTHPIISSVSDEQSKSEIMHSWQRLKTELKNPVPVFCYPNGSKGDFGKREIEFLKTTDMIGALSTIHKQLEYGIRDDNALYSLPRHSLPDDFDDFRMYSSWLEYAKERARKAP